MPFVQVRGIDVYYERQDGSADSGAEAFATRPRLMFLNGSGATLAASAMMLAVFSPGFDLVAHDQRGTGRTSIPEGPYSMADYALDALGLADALGWESFRVVGVSFGGMVAQELAVTAPERVERLALVCTSSGGAGGASYPLHTLPEMDPDSLAAFRPRLLDTRFTPEWLAAHERDRVLAEAMTNRMGDGKSADVLRGERLQLEARSRLDVFDRLPVITCPTLVASGRFDGIAPAANGRNIAAQIHGAEFREYDGGHAFFYQDRQAFPDIVSFLAS